MARVFGELKPQERALLWLAHVEGSSHEEIAEALNVKTASVKVMLFRARKRLGELLTAKGLAPEGAR
jgi:RNA polymerase sigma-70 factor (ECF subfamily)